MCTYFKSCRALLTIIVLQTIFQCTLIYIELSLLMTITMDFVWVNSYIMFYEIRCLFPWRWPDVFILRHLYQHITRVVFSLERYLKELPSITRIFYIKTLLNSYIFPTWLSLVECAALDAVITNITMVVIVMINTVIHMTAKATITSTSIYKNIDKRIIKENSHGSLNFTLYTLKHLFINRDLLI